MAKKKTVSQAERAASRSEKARSSAAKTASGKKRAGKEEQASVSPRLILALVSLALFILFLVMLLHPEGAVIRVIYSVLLGLIGKGAFVIAIPCLLYLFIIQAFSGKRPVCMRSICLLCFAFLCGCISHLYLNPQNPETGIHLIRALYEGGIRGTTGGLLCGSVAELMQWMFASVVSYIILILGAALTLLASFQITIPSLIRAIRNRPRADWEDEPEERVDPASLVVNHIATRRIAYVENRRSKGNAAKVDIPLDDTPAGAPKTSKKAKELMQQIAQDVDAPVAAAGIPAGDDAPAEISEKPAMDEPAMEEKAVIPEMPEPLPGEMPPLERLEPMQQTPVEPQSPRKITGKDVQDSTAQIIEEIAQNAVEEQPEYTIPPIDLLQLPRRGALDGTAEMRENSRRLNETLASFRIEAHIINVTRGPSVTRYEVELEKGVRLNKLTSCADDIALNLGASGVRIAAVPGKISVVGIEVPNRSVTTVSLREVIDSPEFRRAKSKSSFAVGKDIGGSCIVGNISRLPHMLIAGTTGSGKSVCMNSIIISLLYKAAPEDVKLIMVDPKMVELGIYNGIPHLLIPVVTDPKKAAGALQWAVTEMMRRYRAMSDAGVRDLESYNGMVDSQQEEGERLPQVVVIIDELADLMLVAAKEVEESICRIAQMGRAAGIHLIIATQRPSADVITGLMKANIPSRIAFAVASAMESRIILDTQGAEKLVGKGDMLFAPIGSGKPLRVQGCFVSDAEVERVTDHVKQQYTVNYDPQVQADIDRKAAQTGSKSGATESDMIEEDMDGDVMLPDAVDVILETGQASVSMLQRRLKLGYARAARIVDEMEEKGIVGPFQGSKPRSILITKEEWAARRSGQPKQMDFEDLEETGPGLL